MEAVEDAREEVLDLLPEWGVDLTIRTDQGWTVLLIAEDTDFAPKASIIEKLRLAAPEDAYERYLQDREEDRYEYGTEVEEDETKEIIPHLHQAPLIHESKAQ